MVSYAIPYFSLSIKGTKKNSGVQILYILCPSLVPQAHSQYIFQSFTPFFSAIFQCETLKNWELMGLGTRLCPSPGQLGGQLFDNNTDKLGLETKMSTRAIP